MGSLENGISLKKDQQHNQHQNFNRAPSFPGSRISRARSRFPRFLLSKRLGYLHWISTIVIFSLFLVFFQAFLPGSIVDRPGQNSIKFGEPDYGDSIDWKGMGILGAGQDFRFEPGKVLEKLRREAIGMNISRSVVRFGHRKPQLALVFADLAFDEYQILMSTVAAALQEMGYSIEVFSPEDGPATAAWRHIGVPVNIILGGDHDVITVDWLNYDGILVNSLEAKSIFSCFLQEPFKSLPLIWTIHEKTLATRLNHYSTSGKIDIVNDWKKSFNRATVVVFQNHALLMTYSMLDTGNYFVIPGAPTEEWEVDSSLASDEANIRSIMGLSQDDCAIAIVGSHFFYKSLWLEHALVLQSLMPLLEEFQPENNSTHLKIFILTGDSTDNYTSAVEAISNRLGYPTGIVKHVAGDVGLHDVLLVSNLVIYGSLLEEQVFPDILRKAMGYGKLIIAPDLAIVKKYIDDKVNGYIYPKEDSGVLMKIVSQAVSGGKLSPVARNVASVGKGTAKNLMVLEAIVGYALLLENALRFPSEVAYPQSVSAVSSKNKMEWWGDIFKMIPDVIYKNRTSSTGIYLDKLEEQLNPTRVESTSGEAALDEAFVYHIWEEQKEVDLASAKKKREEEELKGRSDQFHGIWEDVYKNAKKADRTKNILHERDEGELERTGQPLCIYEPYFGEGTWPFLHRSSLYRGIGLSAKGRRRGADDIDASSRLSLLNDAFYRDILGEFGAFFAIAYRVDRTHKNAWIGFQSWRGTARKAGLSKTAEKMLVNSIEARRNGDALYFWMSMDLDHRNPLNLDFWSFCDAINAGNCRSAFSEAFKRMYGVKDDFDSLPPMPLDGDTWSVMHSWALPTRSFLEFVMFARMFVDALDVQMHEEFDPRQTGHCYFSLSKDKYCYSRVLELLINVWAYHSTRRMVYINPETGEMQEQHKLKTRRGKMWVQWFSYNTLKSMDEDLAEEADERPKRHWLWPSTGEVYWQGMDARERSKRQKEKEQKKRQSKEKLDRMRRRQQKQKTIGKYVKYSPEEMEGSNSTTNAVGR